MTSELWNANEGENMEHRHCSLNYTAILGPDCQPPTHSSSRSVSLNVFLKIACLSKADVALRASASALIRVFQGQPQLSETRRSVELSTTSFCPFRCRPLEHILSSATLVFRPVRYFDTRGCSWSSDGDVQTLQLVPGIVATTSILTDLYLSLALFVFELL